MKRRVGKPSGIIIHHTLTKDGKVEDYNSVKKYHMQQMKMEDIGYHFFIEEIGGEIRTIQGRPVDMTGAHTVGKNETHLGICVTGNFDSEVMSADKMTALVSCTKALMNQFGISADRVDMHRTFAPYKSCPGWKFPWKEFKERLA